MAGRRLGKTEATAKIGNNTWEKAIWFDIKMNTYLLPQKPGSGKKEMWKREKT